MKRRQLLGGALGALLTTPIIISNPRIIQGTVNDIDPSKSLVVPQTVKVHLPPGYDQPLLVASDLPGKTVMSMTGWAYKITVNRTFDPYLEEYQKYIPSLSKVHATIEVEADEAQLNLLSNVIYGSKFRFHIEQLG